ncbi:glycosyltransferase family 4 protein [Winogradskyella sp. SYSU M77433]|uniref:glycosyltransferase family 4 protein n=1 Tax=Winogradskyella sp. SYSU M77433 TaxID=3042722 RepID=UPI00248125F8|nr:glycosyltransferase family 4 protein [Winogradskyella sp. SYSU M77433]MDH7912604.1 glycosyltransferase family 4 protein [Winogradskyella sp. SYSU M77433]
MRLLLIVNRVDEAHGLVRIVVFQTNYFIKHYGYEVELLILDSKSRYKEAHYDISKKAKLNYFEAKGGFDFFYKVQFINSMINNISPDVIMVCIDHLFGLTLPYFIKRASPLIYQRHSTKSINIDRISRGWKVKLNNKIKQILISKAGAGYDSFVILSEQHKKDWKHLKNIHVINNPVTIDSFGETADLKAKTVVAIGRQDYVKGYDMLLDVWKKVQESHPDWKLEIYGKVNKSLGLEEKSKRLGLDQSIKFYNHTSNIKEVYLKSSILVCSSRIEGFPLVFIEAMSLGVPVISFDCPYGPRSIINHDEDGLLVEANNIDKMVESIEKLITDEKTRKYYGKNAKVNANRFLPEKIYDQWDLLFKSVLKQND